MIIISNVLRVIDGSSLFFSKFWQRVANIWENSRTNFPSLWSVLKQGGGRNLHKEMKNVVV